ncbi:ASN_collapsed_G0017180.mRNA.1.CDS.1 [Saccharomyces cerevisiae]|nr:ASN_collapsed_G0017180.mRNA.1.CDS.1 [Saccharomyces cerevisiae]
MSDAGRKGFGEKASEALKPDSQKSYAEQGKEYITDKPTRSLVRFNQKTTRVSSKVSTTPPKKARITLKVKVNLWQTKLEITWEPPSPS